MAIIALTNLAVFRINAARRDRILVQMIG